MPLQTKFLIAAAAVLLSFFLGALGGWSLKTLQVKADLVDATKQQAKADVEQAARASDAVQTNEQSKSKTEIRYVTVTKEVEKLVERPVYLERCIDDDGMRAINSQILGFDSAKP